MSNRLVGSEPKPLRVCIWCGTSAADQGVLVSGDNGKTCICRGCLVSALRVIDEAPEFKTPSAPEGDVQ